MSYRNDGQHHLSGFSNQADLHSFQEAAKKPGSVIKWKYKVKFDENDPFNESYQQCPIQPIVEHTQCLFSIALDGLDRFLFVEIEGLPKARGMSTDAVACFRSQYSDQYWAPMKLFLMGIAFRQRRYTMFGGEIAQGTGNLCLWFFAESSKLNVHAARNLLGNLGTLPAGKCNARLKLGFSPIYAGLKVAEDNILIIDDIYSADGSLMTDGCGYIAHNLARQLPYGIHQGIANQDRHENMSVPAVVQIRCVCKKGLYKGCLIVIADTSICPDDTIKFRPSMHKDNSDITSLSYPSEEVIVGIVSTFEHPEVMANTRQRDMAEHCIRLNRSLCLLLHHLGAPGDYFEALLEEQMDVLTKAQSDRNSAYSLVRQALYSRPASNKPPHLDFSPLGSEDDDEDDDDYTVVSEYYTDEDIKANKAPTYSSPLRQTTAEQARDFLINGHALYEPLYVQLVKKLQLQKMQHLQRCHVTLRRAIYLVGVADAYNYLQSHQVFICFPQDTTYVRNRKLKINIGYIEGEVLVTRHPMCHPGDVRKYTAVYHPHFASQLMNSSGGMIVFPTQGARAAGDMMSGGDYDGDQYVIIYTGDDLINEVKVVEPYLEPISKPNSPMAPSPPHATCDRHTIVRDECRLCVDSQGWDIMRSLLQTSQNSYVGRYSNAWLAWADCYSPAHPNALQCGKIVNDALDAAKKGTKIPYRGDLLNTSYPHYMVDENKGNKALAAASSGRAKYQSRSILGKLFDLILKMNVDGERIARDQPFLFDYDLLYVKGHETWNPDTLARRKCSGYHDLAIQCNEFYRLFPVYIPYLEEWRQHVTEYKKGISVILNALSKDTVDGKTSVRRQNASVKATPTQCSEDKVQKLKLDHRSLFQSKAKEFSLLHAIAEDKACNRLAGFVYLATYYNAMQASMEKVHSVDKMRFALSYCWDICGVYLHENKREREKMLSSQPSADALPMTELHIMIG